MIHSPRVDFDFELAVAFACPNGDSIFVRQ